MIYSKDLFYALIQNSSDIITILQTDGTILYESPSVERLFGYTQEELIGKNAFEMVHPLDVPHAMRAFTEVVQNPARSLSAEFRFRHKNGSWRVLESTGSNQLDNPMITGIVINSRDITERKDAELKLQESEQKYRKIFENVQDVFYQADLNGNIIEISPSIERYSGYSREELIGRPIINFYYYPEDRARLLDAMKRKGQITDFEVRLKTKDGRLVYTSVNSHFLVNEAGNPVGIEGSLWDVTERKRLESQLVHSQRMDAIGQFVGGIVHNFNNILSAIIGHGHLLEMKMRDDDPRRAHVDHMMESSDKAAQLIHSLLAFSRTQTLNSKPVHLNEIIKKVEKILKPIIREDIALKVTLKEDDLHVTADSGQIEQVLMNLAANARDAMPRGGALTITSGRTELDENFVRAYGYGEAGAYALVSVTDTGTGMDEETRKRIFEPFFTTKEIGRGTGLGLATAYGIIKLHKGYITVSSELGKGTTFKIYLPVTDAAPAKENSPESASYPPEGTETILLAEDDVTLRSLSESILREHGYKVIAAENGEEAIQRFIEHKDDIQLVLLDMVMPIKNGKEAYAEIKKIRPDIKVLFVSGHTDLEQSGGVPNEGLDFMSKPISPKLLLRRVRAILDR